MFTRITREALKAKMDRGDRFVLVESLPAAAFHHAHLPGAINIPPGELAAAAPKLVPDLGADIVVYCASPT
jgi:rhodanese-related sulfurtransferase